MEYTWPGLYRLRLKSSLPQAVVSGKKFRVDLVMVNELGLFSGDDIVAECPIPIRATAIPVEDEAMTIRYTVECEVLTRGASSKPFINKKGTGSLIVNIKATPLPLPENGLPCILQFGVSSRCRAFDYIVPACTAPILLIPLESPLAKQLLPKRRGLEDEEDEEEDEDENEDEEGGENGEDSYVGAPEDGKNTGDGEIHGNPDSAVRSLNDVIVKKIAGSESGVNAAHEAKMSRIKEKLTRGSTVVEEVVEVVEGEGIQGEVDEDVEIIEMYEDEDGDWVEEDGEEDVDDWREDMDMFGEEDEDEDMDAIMSEEEGSDVDMYDLIDTDENETKGITATTRHHHNHHHHHHHDHTHDHSNNNPRDHSHNHSHSTQDDEIKAVASSSSNPISNTADSSDSSTTKVSYHAFVADALYFLSLPIPFIGLVKDAVKSLSSSSSQADTQPHSSISQSSHRFDSRTARAILTAIHDTWAETMRRGPALQIQGVPQRITRPVSRPLPSSKSSSSPSSSSTSSLSSSTLSSKTAPHLRFATWSEALPTVSLLATRSPLLDPATGMFWTERGQGATLSIDNSGKGLSQALSPAAQHLVGYSYVKEHSGHDHNGLVSDSSLLLMRWLRRLIAHRVHLLDDFRAIDLSAGTGALGIYLWHLANNRATAVAHRILTHCGVSLDPSTTTSATGPSSSSSPSSSQPQVVSTVLVLEALRHLSLSTMTQNHAFYNLPSTTNPTKDNPPTGMTSALTTTSFPSTDALSLLLSASTMSPPHLAALLLASYGLTCRSSVLLTDTASVLEDLLLSNVEMNRTLPQPFWISRSSDLSSVALTPTPHPSYDRMNALSTAPSFTPPKYIAPVQLPILASAIPSPGSVPWLRNQGTMEKHAVPLGLVGATSSTSPFADRLLVHSLSSSSSSSSTPSHGGKAMSHLIHSLPSMPSSTSTTSTVISTDSHISSSSTASHTSVRSPSIEEYVKWLLRTTPTRPTTGLSAGLFEWGRGASHVSARVYERAGVNLRMVLASRCPCDAYYKGTTSPVTEESLPTRHPLFKDIHNHLTRHQVILSSPTQPLITPPSVFSVGSISPDSSSAHQMASFNASSPFLPISGNHFPPTSSATPSSLSSTCADNSVPLVAPAPLLFDRGADVVLASDLLGVDATLPQLVSAISLLFRAHLYAHAQLDEYYILRKSLSHFIHSGTASSLNASSSSSSSSSSVSASSSPFHSSHPAPLLEFPPPRKFLPLVLMCYPLRSEDDQTRVETDVFSPLSTYGIYALTLPVSELNGQVDDLFAGNVTIGSPNSINGTQGDINNQKQSTHLPSKRFGKTVYQPHETVHMRRLEREQRENEIPNRCKENHDKKIQTTMVAILYMTCGNHLPLSTRNAPQFNTLLSQFTPSPASSPNISYPPVDPLGRPSPLPYLSPFGQHLFKVFSAKYEQIHGHYQSNEKKEESPSDSLTTTLNNKQNEDDKLCQSLEHDTTTKVTEKNSPEERASDRKDHKQGDKVEKSGRTESAKKVTPTSTIGASGSQSAAARYMAKIKQQRK